MADLNGIKESMVMALGSVVEAKLHLYDYDPGGNRQMSELIRAEGRLLQEARDRIAAAIGKMELQEARDRIAAAIGKMEVVK